MEHFPYICIQIVVKMEIKPRFKVILSKRVTDFLDSLSKKIRDKILYNVAKSRSVIDPELFKKLDDDIWEFRTLYGNMHYRLLAFWDNDGQTLVITTHGFIKKTGKTPKKEIDKAIEIRTLYYNSKKWK